MGANKCKEIEKSLEGIHSNLIVENKTIDPNENYLINEDDNNKSMKLFPKMMKFLLKNKNKGLTKEITEQEIQTAIRKTFPKAEQEKAELIVKILGALNNYPLFSDIFYSQAKRYLQYTIPAGQEQLDAKFYLKDANGNLIPNLDQMPLGTIKVLADYLHFDLIGDKDNKDLKIQGGIIGGLTFEYETIERIKERSKNPLFRAFINKMKYSQANVDSITREYQTAQPEKQLSPEQEQAPPKLSINEVGFNNIIKTVLPSEWSKWGKNYFKNSEELMAIIFMYLQDRIIINRDNGEFYYHLSDSKTKVGEYKDGSGKYRYMKQEELVMVNKEFVNEDINLKESQLAKPLVLNKKDLKEFLLLKSAFAQRLETFGKYAKIRAEENNKKMDELTTEKELLSEDKQKELDVLFSLFHKEIAGIHGLNKYRLKENRDTEGDLKYFPRMYLNAVRIHALNEKMYSLNKAIKGIDTKLRTKKIKLQDRRKLYKELRDKETTSKRILNILNELSTNDDFDQGNNLILSKNYVKHFRKITHLLDDKKTNLHPTVIEDYLNYTTESLERNELITSLIELYIKTDGNPKEKEFALNLFRRKYNHLDAKGRFLGFSFTDEAFAEGLSTLPGVKINPYKLRKFLRKISAFEIGNLLSGVTDGPQNFASVSQDMVVQGFDTWFEAFGEYIQDPDGWQQKAERAGVITYIKYLEGYVDKTLRSAEVNANREITKETKKEIKKYTKALAEQHDAITKEEFLIKKKNAERVLKVLKETQPDWVQRYLSHFATFAITHKWNYSKEDSKAKLAQIASLYAIVPSIQTTETALRTTAFVIGYKQALRINANATEKQLFEMAKEYVYQTQFSLEPVAAGEAFGNVVTKTGNSMATWRSQALQFGLDILRRARNSLIDSDSLLNIKDGELDNKKRGLQFKKRMELLGRNIMTSVNNPLSWGLGTLMVGMSTGLGVPVLLGSMATVGTGIKSLMPSKKQKIKQEAFKRTYPELSAHERYFATYGATSAFFTFILFEASLFAGLFAGLQGLVFRSQSFKLGLGFISPLYALKFGAIKLTARTLQAFLEGEDDEEKKLTAKDVHNYTRNIWGLGWNNTFMAMYGLAQEVDKLLTHDADSDPKTSAWRQISYGGGAFKNINDLVSKTGVYTEIDNTISNLRYPQAKYKSLKDIK